MESHVLLAACGHDQQARELLTAASEGRGFFTSNLITQLENPGLPLDEMTYVDLHNVLPRSDSQVPQCEGLNKVRFLFQKKQPSGTWFPLTPKSDGIFEVPIGSFHGVVWETEFIVQGQQPTSGLVITPTIMVPNNLPEISSVLVRVVPPPRKDTASTVRSEDTASTAQAEDMASTSWTEDTMSTSTPLRNANLKVAVFNWNNERVTLKVFLQPTCGIPSLLSDGRTSFRVVTLETGANIVVGQDSNNSKLIIERRDDIFRTYASTVIKATISGNLELWLPTVFNAIANFNFFLGQNLRAGQLDQVAVKMYRLNGTYGLFKPNQTDLFNKNKAMLRHDSSANYGFAITNETPYDLFPYLFYFDPASYSIDVRSFHFYNSW